MANLVLSENAAGEEILAWSYFTLPNVLTEAGEAIRPRDAADQNLPVLVGEANGQCSLRPVEWFHRIQSVSVLGGANVFTSPAPLEYSAAGLREINGIETAIDDRVEMPPTVGRSFNPRVPGGTYEIVSLDPPTMRSLKPIIYDINADGIGGAVYYRAVPGKPGSIEGLASPSQASNGVIIQGSVAVGSPLRWIDGNRSTWADARTVNNGQSVSIGINEIPNVLAAEWTIGAWRQSNDTTSKNAFGGITAYLGSDLTSGRNFNWSTSTYRKSTLQVANTNIWANSATGPLTYYHLFDSAVSVFGWRYLDQGNSRAELYDIRPICHSLPCQIRAINGEIPEIGSLVRITEAASAGFLPPIAPGTYPVVENSGTAPWELGPATGT